MADMTREEIDAKIGQANAATDTKFALMNGKLDQMVTEMTNLRGEMTLTRADVKGLRTTIITTGITSGFAVLGLMLAVFAVVLAVQANMLSAFQAGRTVPVVSTDAR